MELRSVIQKFDDNVCMVIGGDWNCTTNFIVDRNGEEPHNQSSMQLLKIINEFDLIDLWRSRNIGVRQYTWLKVSDNQVSGARLDRFYLGKIWNNKVMNVSILPNGFSDHHMITFDFNLKKWLNLVIFGILMSNCYKTLVSVKSLSFFGMIGNLRKTLLKILVNGGMSVKQISGFFFVKTILNILLH